MMNSAAIKAPLAAEPMLDALRALSASNLRTTPDEPAVFAPTQAPARSTTALAVADPAVTEAATVAPSTDRAIAWVEPTENLWLLSIKNFGLTLATFGVYHFWGQAETRRQTVNAVHINGQPVEYTGTGKEGFVSFVLGAVIACTLVGAFVYLLNSSQAGGGIAGVREIRWHRLMISLPLMFLLGSIVYRKRQHILRRTWINGQRFDLSGHAWGYAWQHFWTAFLIPLTAGLAAPWRASRLEARKITEMHHGDFTFHAAPRLAPVYKVFALLWLGGGLTYVATLIVLAQHIGPQLLDAIATVSLQPLLSWPVAQQGLSIAAVGLFPLALLLLTYRKAWLEHQISSIAFKTGQLELSLPLGRYLALSIGNLLLKLASLGALTPVAEARSMRFLISHLTVKGSLDLGKPPGQHAK
jgi:uncharacterized membrane protein YjgN (DUF898 family)